MSLRVILRVIVSNFGHSLLLRDRYIYFVIRRSLNEMLEIIVRNVAEVEKHLKRRRFDTLIGDTSRRSKLKKKVKPFLSKSTILSDIDKLELESRKYWILGKSEEWLRSRSNLLEKKREWQLSLPLNGSSLMLLDPACTATIGHLATTIELLILSERKGCQTKYLLPKAKSANSKLLEYLKKISSVESREIKDFTTEQGKVLGFFQELDTLHFANHSLWTHTQGYNYLKDCSKEHEGISRLSLVYSDREKAESDLARIGFKNSDWFVTFHISDSKAHVVQADGTPPLVTYRKAMEWVADNGGWVFRMGHKGMPKLESTHPRIIDYANSPLKSETTDLYLCANSRFFVGTNSGPASVPPIFGVPVLFTNAPRIGFVFKATGFYIPMRIFNNASKKYLSMEEWKKSPLAATPIRNWNNEIRVPNTEIEILESVKEMMITDFTNNQDNKNSILFRSHINSVAGFSNCGVLPSSFEIN